MKRRLSILLVMVLAVVFMGAHGYAVPIQYEEGSLTVTAHIVKDVAEVLPVVVEEVPEEEAAEEEAEPAEAEEAAEEEAEPAEAEEPAEEEAAEPEAEEAEAEEEEVVDDSIYELDSAEFHLLGQAADGSWIIFADSMYLTVPAEALDDLLSQLDASAISSMPKIETLAPIVRRDKGDAVVALQEELIELGYMSGKADGSYGGSVQKAVSAFQKAMGLPQTGEADPLTQMLIVSAMQEPVTVVPHIDPAERYAAIAGKTDANLDVLAEARMILDYDDIEGTGTISNRKVIAFDGSGESDIDHYGFTLQFVMLVRQGEDGMVTIDPAVCVSCECVRRPIMQEIILKSGDERHTLAFTELNNGLNGAKSVETGIALLDDATVEMLANASGEGELKVRINGKYQSFDTSLSEEDLAAVSALGQTAKALH